MLIKCMEWSMFNSQPATTSRHVLCRCSNHDIPFNTGYCYCFHGLWCGSAFQLESEQIPIVNLSSAALHIIRIATCWFVQISFFHLLETNVLQSATCFCEISEISFSGGKNYCHIQNFIRRFYSRTDSTDTTRVAVLLVKAILQSCYCQQPLAQTWKHPVYALASLTLQSLPEGNHKPLNLQSKPSPTFWNTHCDGQMTGRGSYTALAQTHWQWLGYCGEKLECIKSTWLTVTCSGMARHF